MGSISFSGLYTAPTVTSQSYDTVSVISVADSSKYASGSVTVTSAASTGSAYSLNANAVTTKLLPSDVFSHCYGDTSNCVAGDLIAKCALTDCGTYADTPMPQQMGTLLFASPGNSDNEDAFYYSCAGLPVCSTADPYGSVIASTPTGNQTIVFRFPSGAKFPEGSPAGSGNECQITVWDQSTGWVVGFYRSGSCAGSAALPVASGCGSTTATACSIPTGEVSASANLFTAQDYGYYGSGSTSPQSSDQFAPAAGMLRHEELVNGTINHAFIFTVDCVSAGTLSGTINYIFPVLRGGYLGKCGLSGFGADNADRPPAGALLFTDYTTAQLATICASVPTWQCTMLTTMSTYGGYVGITSAAGVNLSMRGNEELESSEAWKYYNPSAPCAFTAGTNCYNDTFWGWATVQNGFDGTFNISHTGCFGGSGTNPSTWRCEGAFLTNIPELPGWAGSTDVEGNDCSVKCYPSGHIHMADKCIAQGYAGVSGGCF